MKKIYLTDGGYKLQKVTIEYTMSGTKKSVNNGKVIYLSPNKKDILIYDPHNPMVGTIFPNDRDNKGKNKYIQDFILENGGVKF